jgi:hypothetical protein
VVVLLVRRNVPESPRWMFIHGRAHDAETLVDGIEERVARDNGTELPETGRSITIRQRKTIGFMTIARTMVTLYPRRTFFGIKNNPGYYLNSLRPAAARDRVLVRPAGAHGHHADRLSAGASCCFSPRRAPVPPTSDTSTLARSGDWYAAGSHVPSTVSRAPFGITGSL